MEHSAFLMKIAPKCGCAACGDPSIPTVTERFEATTMQRILVVDDDRNILGAIKRIAGRQYDVLIAGNGDTALSILGDRGDICAIISDMRMHGMSGIEFLERAKKIAPHVPRIMLTGYIDADVLTDAINRASVYHFLKKPVESPRLLGILDECVELVSRAKAADPNAPDDQKIADALKDANPGEEFSLLYQPRVCSISGQTKSVEALMRWNSPVLGPVSPAVFIPAAEKSGDIAWITDWALVTACRAWAKWRDTAGASMSVSVNISPVLFKDARLVDTVSQAIDMSGIEPECLELEITEGLELNQRNTVIETIAGIKTLGVRLSLDDFGTGFASFSYLQSLDVDCLKVDRSFVSNATSNPTDGAILRTVQQLGKRLGVKTVAEGIEDMEHADFVRALGYDEMQGYHFSKPIPADELTAWMQMHPASAA